MSTAGIRSKWTEVAARLADRVSFDYVLVHYIFYTRIFEAFPSNARRIIDTHDSFANRSRRFAAQGVPTEWWSCSPRGEVMALRRGKCIMASQPGDGEIFKHGLGVNGNVVTVGPTTGSRSLKHLHPLGFSRP